MAKLSNRSSGVWWPTVFIAILLHFRVVFIFIAILISFNLISEHLIFKYENQK